MQFVVSTSAECAFQVLSGLECNARGGVYGSAASNCCFSPSLAGKRESGCHIDHLLSLVWLHQQYSSLSQQPRDLNHKRIYNNNNIKKPTQKMATKHDGSDHQHRQRILPHYQLMALSKKRLKFMLILHLLLACMMAGKLLPTVLDLLNIFWQPIEELYIPMAKPWEWVWFGGALVVVTLYKSIRTNNPLQLKLLSFALTLTSILPLFYCAYIYASDFRLFVMTRDSQKTSEVWRDYPVALYWFGFICVAFQVHFFELYFVWDLLKSMSSHKSLTSKNK